MSAPDWTVLFGALALFVGYGLWRGRGTRDLDGYLRAGRSLGWPSVMLSVMATQASAITFLSAPGQGFADGLRFVQFYFGLPIAMVVLCAIAVPVYRRLGVFTAYQYLEERFDARVRTLASGLFLLQRGLSAGLTLYAPALVLSVLLGWDVRLTCVLLGGLAVIYTTTGGSRAVSHAHGLQFVIIMATMVLAFVLIVRALPAGVGIGDALAIAGRAGRMRAVVGTFDPNDRYNLWSGLIGGFLLQLSYFGTDQSQVGRYLTGRTAGESRRGLLANGLLKVPMQCFILLLGVMVFVFYQFTPAPLFFNPVMTERMAQGSHAHEWAVLESNHDSALAERLLASDNFVAARHESDRAARAEAAATLEKAQAEVERLRREAGRLVAATYPGAQSSDTNYVFLGFVLTHLPVGIIGLVLAAIFAAAMNSSSAELSALASTTLVDFVQRAGGAKDERRGVLVSRIATVAWAAFAVAFAEYFAHLGSLIEAVNVLGSLFYGTILGIFLTAFLLPRVGGVAVFAAALIAEAAVLACFRYTGLSFLWYNLIGCAGVMLIALALKPLDRAVPPRRRAV